MQVLEEGAAVQQAGQRIRPRPQFQFLLQPLGVEVLGGVRLSGIDADAVRFEYCGRAGSVPADTVIIAGDPAPDTSFADALAGRVGEIHAIGDCTGPGLLRKAVEDGMRAGVAV